MLVRMLTDLSGPCWQCTEGEVYDLPPVQAERLIETGQAERVAEERPPEAAALAPAAETAMKSRPLPRRK